MGERDDQWEAGAGEDGDDTGNEVVCRCFGSCAASLNAILGWWRDSKGSKCELTSGTNTSRVGIVRREAVSRGKNCPTAYVTREICLGSCEKNGLRTKARVRGRADMKKIVPEPMLANWRATAIPACMARRLVHRVFSLTFSTDRYCETKAPEVKFSESHQVA